MKLRHLKALLLKDVVWAIRDWEFALLIIGPVVVALGIHFGIDLLTDGVSDPPEAVLVNLDVGGEFAEALTAGGSIEVIETVASLEEAVPWVRDGKAVAAIEIPAGFSEASRTSQMPRLSVRFDSNKLSEVERVRRALTRATQRFAYPTPAAAIELTAISGVPFSMEAYLVHLAVVMEVLFVGLFFLPLSLGEEKEKGILDALILSPATLGEIIGAKLLFGTLMIIFSSVLMMGLSHGAALLNGWAMVFIGAGAACFVSLGLLLALLARTRKHAEMTATGALLLFTQPLFLGEALPKLEAVANALPSAWFSAGLKEGLADTASPGAQWTRLALLLVVTLACGVASRYVLNRRIG